MRFDTGDVFSCMACSQVLGIHEKTKPICRNQNLRKSFIGNGLWRLPLHEFPKKQSQFKAKCKPCWDDILLNRRGLIEGEGRDRGANAGVQDSDSHFVGRGVGDATDAFVADGLALGDLLPLAILLDINGEFGDALTEVADLLLEHDDIEGLFSG